MLCLVLLLVAGTAVAQPVKFQLDGDVPIGKKPALKITAAQKVSELRVQLERDDGKKFEAKHAGLAAGQSVSLPIGDGAAGKASYQGTLTLVVAGKGSWSHELIFETLVRAPLKVTYDAEHLDLDKRVLQFKLSRPAGKAELVALGEDGGELGKGAATYSGKDPVDTWLAISWTQPASTRVMKLEVRITAADGQATRLELIPWSVEIAHEDVSFATDSSAIEPGEEKKLDASLAKIAEVVKRSERFVKMKLYVAGHTDTVGPSAKNRKLSLARARAIAGYFKKRGLALPVAVAGYGEDVLKVKTADETDERANRRADYVIGPAGAPPPFRGPYLQVRAAWEDVR